MEAVGEARRDAVVQGGIAVGGDGGAVDGKGQGAQLVGRGAGGGYGDGNGGGGGEGNGGAFAVLVPAAVDARIAGGALQLGGAFGEAPEGELVTPSGSLAVPVALDDLVAAGYSPADQPADIGRGRLLHSAGSVAGDYLGVSYIPADQPAGVVFPAVVGAFVAMHAGGGVAGADGCGPFASADEAAHSGGLGGVGAADGAAGDAGVVYADAFHPAVAGELGEESDIIEGGAGDEEVGDGMPVAD